MSDEKAQEAEVVENGGSDLADAIAAVVDETVKLVDALGRAVLTTLEDASNLMVIKVNPETREHLDLLVSAGVAKNRCKAAASLIDEGITSKAGTFDRIRRTQEQISELRQQMRTLVKTHA
ncbi:MAG: hypothetical protein JXC32_08955 [Anaerolineae bacterium]|nr:hypothetical protein [Anaerolineae bacterium]